jgi:hypothetical protein
VTTRRSALLLLLAALTACSRAPDTAESPTAETAHAPTAEDLARAAAAGAAAARRRAAQSGLPSATGGAVAPEPAPEPAPPSKTDADGYADVDWTALMPHDELDRLRRGVAIDHRGDKPMAQFGSFHTVSTYTDKKIRLAGYVVPLTIDADQRMTEFLFVPYFGACIHVPPPPPNQLVYVHLAQAVKAPDPWDPQWLRGVLRTERFDGDAASAAYTMADATMKPYEG